MARIPYVEIKTLVIGGGVIGVAVARAAALRSPRNVAHQVCLVEREAHLGQHTTSRNSEVIHAGIYYPLGSLKAKLCVRGRRLLYRYAEERKIPHRKIEKLIVARSDQELAPLYHRGLENGVEGLSLLSSAQTRALEPELTPSASLYSRQTGIIDSHAYVRQLARDCRAAGGEISLRTEVTDIERVDEQAYLVTLGGPHAAQVRCQEVINSAGLWAPWVMAWAPPNQVKEMVTYAPSYAMGRYFSLRRPPPVTRLIYPLPEAGGLGIHLTWDLNGRAKLGPDVHWIDGPASSDEPVSYHWSDQDQRLQTQFYEQARRYLPMLRHDDLTPDQCGLRVKSSPRDTTSPDFLILGGAERGSPGLIHLIGIESPGLTASLAIAEYVIERLTPSPLRI